MTRREFLKLASLSVAGLVYRPGEFLKALSACDYQVQQGDNLFRIAKRFGVSVRFLQEANNISNPERIYVGQKLIVPCGGNQSAAVAAELPVNSEIEPRHLGHLGVAWSQNSSQIDTTLTLLGIPNNHALWTGYANTDREGDMRFVAIAKGLTAGDLDKVPRGGDMIGFNEPNPIYPTVKDDVRLSAADAVKIYLDAVRSRPDIRYAVPNTTIYGLSNTHDQTFGGTWMYEFAQGVLDASWAGGVDYTPDAWSTHLYLESWITHSVAFGWVNNYLNWLDKAVRKFPAEVRNKQRLSITEAGVRPKDGTVDTYSDVLAMLKGLKDIAKIGDVLMYTDKESTTGSAHELGGVDLTWQNGGDLALTRAGEAVRDFARQRFG